MTCLHKPNVMSIDIETFSDVDLGKQGVYRYAQSPNFEILTFAYAYDNNPVEVVDLTKDPLPEHCLANLTDPSVTKTAFNASFERICINTFFGIDTGDWDCTMIRAWELGYAGGLANVGAMLKLKEEERKINGSTLIRTFCCPRKPSKNNPATRWYPEDKPDKWEAFVEYNRRDVEAERNIRNKLLGLPIYPREFDLYHLDQRINDRGILIDTAFCEAAISISDSLVEAKKERYLALTGIGNPNSLVQLKEWIKANTGVEVGSVTKETLPDLIKLFEPYPEVVEVLQIRALLGKTSVAKYHKMLETACDDNRSRGNTQFFGAKTGRWSGKNIQLQNLPQNHLEDLDTARAVVETGDYELVEMLYPDTTDVLRQCIRTAIIPPPGKKFIVADFSAIEARVIAWLAGEQWRLDVFEQGGDIYCASASQMFGVPVVKHGVNGHLRQKGKVAELALGYAGSVGALKNMGALKMGIPENELPSIVSKWRKASPHVVELWHKIEDGVLDALADRSLSQHVGITDRLSAQYENGILFITLPSGRRMGYVGMDFDKKTQKLSYTDQVQGKVARVETYYGKLTENVVQATARDCLAYSMMALEAKGYKIIFHVHDEVIIEVDEDQDCLDDVCAIMGAPIPWASGLPLRADGYECNYYKKD